MVNQIQSKIEDIYLRYLNSIDGAPASYIPELAKANPRSFAIAITTVKGEVFCIGDSEVLFSMQSTSKPFTYGNGPSGFGKSVYYVKSWC